MLFDTIISHGIDPQQRPNVVIEIDWDQCHLRALRARLDDNTPVGILLPLGQGLSPDALLRDSTTGILARVRLRPTAILVTANLSPGLSAHLCLELGNLHLPAEVRQDRIIVNDTETNRSLLTRMNVKFEASVDVFIPERTTMLQAVSISPDFTVRRERVV